MKLIEELARRQKRAVTGAMETESDAGVEDRPGMGFSQTTTKPNVFGGQDEYKNGRLVSSWRPNIFGGFDKTVFCLRASDGRSADYVESVLAYIIGHHGVSHDH